MGEVATDSNPERSTLRRWLGLGARALLGIALLCLALWLSRDQVAEVIAHRPDLRLFGLGFLFYFGGVLLAHLRWYILVRALELPFRPVDAMRLGLVGTFFNLVIPGAVGGDVVKAAFLAREQHHKGRSIATVVIDRIVGLIGLFALAAVTGAYFWGQLGDRIRGVVAAAWIALAVAASLLLIAFVMNPRGPLMRRISRSKKGEKFVAELHTTGLAYRKRPGVVILGVAMSAVTHLGNVLAFASIGRALFPPEELPTFAQNLMIVPLVLFSTAIPLPFGAIGASEGISAVLFESASFRGGAVAMLGFRLLQFGGAAIGACVYASNRTQVRRLAASARGPHAAGPSPEFAPTGDSRTSPIT